jgi:hypothetical protein
MSATTICFIIGYIPSFSQSLTFVFFWMPHAEVLYIDNNHFKGSIPSSWGNLNELRILYVQNNQLTGSLPTELGKLVDHWMHGHLYNNYLSGSLPSELGNCDNLQTLELQSNQFTGFVPYEWGWMPHLQVLKLDGNHLGGTIPSTLCPTTTDMSRNSIVFLSADCSSPHVPTYTNSIVRQANETKEDESGRSSSSSSNSGTIHCDCCTVCYYP